MDNINTIKFGLTPRCRKPARLPPKKIIKYLFIGYSDVKFNYLSTVCLNMKQMPPHDRSCERYEPAGILVHPAPPQQSGYKVVTLYASYNLKTTKDMNFLDLIGLETSWYSSSL